MKIKPDSLNSSPIGESSSNLETNNVESKKQIPKSGAAYCSADKKAMVDRSVIETKKITADDFIDLIDNQNFSNDVHYLVQGDLDLSDLDNLTTLPKNLHVEGDLNLDSCKLKALPENLHVEGYLDLCYCSNLTTFPKKLYVNGALDVLNCNNLTTMPEELTVTGLLRIEDCSKLKTLPKKLHVGGYFDLENCPSLTTFPEDLHVGSNLKLINCSNLTTLSKKLSVGGYLNLSRCFRLTTLPEELTVGSYLNLSRCFRLTTLPEELTVGGYLNLYHCFSLTTLPDTLSVAGDLDLSGCIGLTTLPDWITTIRRFSENSIRRVRLGNTGLSDAYIDELQSTEIDGVAFDCPREQEPFSTLEEVLTFWRVLASSTSEIPELDLRDHQTADLVNYLSRLTATKDYWNHKSRHLLAQRVMAVLPLLAEKGKIREGVLSCIHDALTSCGDRIILALDDIETLQLHMSAETLAIKNNDPGKLKALGLQMMRLDEVKKIAREHMETLEKPDEIEVEMAYQIGVRQQLDLPGLTQQMLFRNHSNVSEQDIAKAVQRVNTRCSETKLEAYLKQWGPWQKFQRRQAKPTYNQLPSKTVDSIGECPLLYETTDQMVELDSIHLDYEALATSYVENGNNPFTRNPVNWSRVVRLIKQAPPPSKNGKPNNE